MNSAWVRDLKLWTLSLVFMLDSLVQVLLGL